MTPRRTSTLLFVGLLAAAGCGLPPGGGGPQPCIDGQEADDPRELSGTAFSTETTRCIDPDNDEDVYDVNPNDGGELTVTCTTDVEDLVQVEIDPSVGTSATFGCAPGGETETITLADGETAQVTFTEGSAGASGEDESYRLEIAFDTD
jgi:hypothetical protein